MKKIVSVNITTKTGNTYSFDEVFDINYNFNHGSMINIALATGNDDREFHTFLKRDIETINVKMAAVESDDNDTDEKTDDGNGSVKPYYLSNDGEEVYA